MFVELIESKKNYFYLVVRFPSMTFAKTDSREYVFDRKDLSRTGGEEEIG